MPYDDVTSPDVELQRKIRENLPKVGIDPYGGVQIPPILRHLQDENENETTAQRIKRIIMLLLGGQQGGMLGDGGVTPQGLPPVKRMPMGGPPRY